MIYVIMPCCNRKDITKKALQCLLKQTVKSWHLILIDNGKDGTELMARGMLKDKVTVITGKYWWSGSINTAVKSLKYINQYDIFVIMNDDNIFEDDFLLNSVFSVEKGTVVTAKCFDKCEKTNGLIVVDWEHWKFQTLHFDSWTTSNLKQEFPQNDYCSSSQALIIYATDFLKIGYFSKLLPLYTSDYEWTLRAVRKGFNIIEGQEIIPLKQQREYGTFSRKYPGNPIYFTLFILLSCPLKHKLKNIIRVWLYAFYRILKQGK